MRMNLILLAAGYSRRFHGKKLLAEIDQKPLYRISIEKLHSLCQRHREWRLLVVASDNEIISFCTEHHISYTINKEPENTGIASSIQKAILSLDTEEKDIKGSPACDVFFTADQPFLDPMEVERFLIAYLDQNQKMGTMECNGIWRNPNIFDISYRPKLLSLTGEQGGKYLMKQFPADVFCYPVSNESNFFDIDTKEDYEQLSTFHFPFEKR